MREPMSEISNTIKHSHFNQTRITRTMKLCEICEDRRHKDDS